MGRMKQFSSPRILSRSLDQGEKYAVSLIIVSWWNTTWVWSSFQRQRQRWRGTIWKKLWYLRRDSRSNDALCSLMFSAENDNVLGFVMIVMRGISFSNINKNMNATKSLLYHSVLGDCELTLRLLVLWSNQLLLCNTFVFATFLLIRLRTFRKIWAVLFNDQHAC